MEIIQPANLFQRLFGKRREVSARVIVSEEAHGRVSVTPTYLLDSEVLPAELLSDDEAQDILGHRVRLSAPAQAVMKQIGRGSVLWSKRSAGPNLLALRRDGVELRDRSDRPYHVAGAHYEGEIRLADVESVYARTDLVTEDGRVISPPDHQPELRSEGGWYTNSDGIYCAPLSTPALDEQLIAATKGLRIDGDAAPKFLAGLRKLKDRLGSFTFDTTAERAEVFDRSNFKSKTMNIDGNASHVNIRPGLEYESARGRHAEPLETAQEARRRGRAYLRVDRGWMCVDDGLVEEVGRDARPYERATRTPWRAVNEEIPEILSKLERDSPWHVYLSAQVKDAHRVVDEPAKARFRIGVHNGPNRSLLELSPMYDHERFSLSHEEATSVVAQGGNWVRRRNSWIRVDKRKVTEVDRALSEERLEATDSGFRFPASSRHRVIEVFSRLGTIEHTESYAQFLAKLADFEKIDDAPLPPQLPPTLHLRPYQKQGYNWLVFLRRFDLNGILADDMGLGKTIQILTALVAAREDAGFTYPSLVICPASVVRNWSDEASTKFPGLFSTLLLDGPPTTRRHRLCSVGMSYNFVIASYAIAHNDFEQLETIRWQYVIFDEAHTLKNPSAKRTQTLKMIPASHKMALTGTPVQNRLLELWSLFDIVMPGYLGKRSHFTERYEGKSRNGRAEAAPLEELKKRVHPFILRRLKQTVARDLPSKIITNRSAELSKIQVQLYKDTLRGQRKDLEREIDRVGTRGAKRQVLELYTRLRNICNHPVLAGHKGEPELKQSGKLGILKEILEEVEEGEHRALLFCQSTQMLDIIERHATEWDHTAIRLDGTVSQQRRADLVKQFQENDSIRLFLISTRAGGTGLNLTAADVVIFYDHDWNPANDSQAMDRAYRIGQTRNVTVFRLVSQGTIEEKILERQASKQELADAVVGSDEEGFKHITKEELLSLFSYDPPPAV